jgi:molybdate transport system substrate-binding protein
LRAAHRICIPDPRRATAGIHFVDVLRRLGIHDEVAPRLDAFPNGATAMLELARRAPGSGSIGCTQTTEIRYTPGVVLVGPLPPEFELATVYSAAVHANARDRALAQRFVDLLTGAASLQLRREGGFE